MKNNKLSLYLLVLLLCTSITSVMAQADVSILTPYSMAIGVDPIKGDYQGGTYAINAGTNRLLVAMVMGEDGSDNNIAPTEVTYGGQPMTKVTQSGVYVAGGTDTYTSMWILKEEKIVNASGDMVVATWNFIPSGNGQVDCILFDNVDQNNPISAFANGTALGGYSIITSSAVLANAGDLVITHVANANFAIGTITWANGFEECSTATRPPSGFGASVAAYKAGTGANETPSYTSNSSQLRRAIVVGVVKKAGVLSLNANQLAANAINVYPNPASGILNIDSDVSSEKVINVINSLGQVVSTTKANGNAQIDLKSLNVSEFVIVQVVADGKVSNHKVIVK